MPKNLFYEFCKRQLVNNLKNNQEYTKMGLMNHTKSLISN